MKKTITKAVVVLAVVTVMVCGVVALNSRVIDPPLPPASITTNITK